MRVAICEDETLIRTIEREQIEAFFEEESVECTVDSFEDGLFLLQSMEGGAGYDLIVLDLQMEHSDGIEVAVRVRTMDPKCEILFVTGLESRATEGYQVQALDYIVKSNLREGMSNALVRFMEKRTRERLAFETLSGEVILVPRQEILWAESENRGSLLVTTDGSYHLSCPIGKVAQKLDGAGFVEIYKSIFVQVCCIRRVGRDTVEMQNGGKLPLSRRKRSLVMKQILAMVGGRL